MSDDTSRMKQLVQTRPAGTAAVSAILKPKRRKLVIKNITICNTTGSSANYSLYLDRNGTTYTEVTALYFNAALAANTTAFIEYNNGLPFDPDAQGNFAVQTSTGNALTFTIDGIEF